MALRFFDGFDHYAIADDTRKWTTRVVTNGSISSSGTRFSSGSYWQVGAWQIGLQKVIDSQATWVFGCAVYVGSAPTNDEYIVVFIDGTTHHVRLKLLANQKLQVSRGDGTVLATGTATVSLSTWHYIEIKVTISDSAGAAEVRLNGVTDINISSVDTRNGGNASADTIQIAGGPSSSGVDMRYDDVYLCDGTGSINNDFLGDVRVSALYPTGAGAHTDWTPSTGSNWQNVDDATSNGDTDYNSSGTPNQIDTYAMGDLPASAASVLGVFYHFWVRKDDAGSRQVAPVVRISGTDYVGTTVTVPSSYDEFHEMHETSPATSAAWTVSEVNGMEYGVKEIA